MKEVVYDLECTINFFSYADVNVKTGEHQIFYIHPSVDNFEEREKFIEYLNTLSLMIGYNNLYYDYPLLAYLIKNSDKFIKASSQVIVDKMYAFSQRIIDNELTSKDKKKYSIYNPTIPQLDLYKIWHFNNKNKRMSLKDVQVSMNYPNIQDMPFKHNDYISEKDIEPLIEYNLNDVDSTLAFYKLTVGDTDHSLYSGTDKIQMRKDLSEIYNLDFLNDNDSSMGEKIAFELYRSSTNSDARKLKEARTQRPRLGLTDCIFDYIQFNSKEFNHLHHNLRQRVLKRSDSFKQSVIYKGFKYDYGLGGIHGCIAPGIYKSDKDYIIIDADVASLYPSIAIQNKLYPKHLGPVFVDIYSGIVERRLKAKADLKSATPDPKSLPLANGLKLAANSIYGKSMSEYSFLYDPKYTYSTTLNGQLMLSMLSESLVDEIEDFTMLQINTDGLTFKIRRTDVEKAYQICKEWEAKTNLILEYVDYEQMIIRDVNSYIAQTTTGKVKYKGAFEADKELHKNNSYRIVPIAVSNYFLNGTPVSETIRNCTNIYDFCGRYKCRTWDGWRAEYHYDTGNGHGIEIMQKTTRYYASNELNVLYKVKDTPSGSKKEVIESTTGVKVFNTYEHESDFENYNVNYKFYETLANKLINSVTMNASQLSLF